MKLTEHIGHGVFATLLSHVLVTDTIQKIVIAMMIAAATTITSHYINRFLDSRKAKGTNGTA